MKYDDARWHSGGDFPTDVPEGAGATHAGIYVAWLLLNGMAGEELAEEMQEELQALASRTTTPGQFLLHCSDGKFVDDLIDEEANAFTREYYAPDDALFGDDYVDVLAGELPTLYHVEDSWANYDLFAPVLEKRIAEWRSRQSPPSTHGVDLPSA